jgi:hypothetical protein
MDMSRTKGSELFLIACASTPLVLLVCAVLFAYCVIGLDYSPWWYRLAAIALLLGYVLRALFWAKATQFVCFFFLAVGSPLAIGMLSQFSKEFAETGAQLAAIFVVMAGIVIAPFLYVAERLRHMRPTRRGSE